MLKIFFIIICIIIIYIIYNISTGKELFSNLQSCNQNNGSLLINSSQVNNDSVTTEEETNNSQVNPYTVQSNNLINDLTETNNISSLSSSQNSTNTYQFNKNSYNCFDKDYLFNRYVNIFIAFNNPIMNNYSNNDNRKLFCKEGSSNDSYSNFGELISNSLHYNNILLNTGSSNENDEWEIISLGDNQPSAITGIQNPKINKCGVLIRSISLNRYLGYGNIRNDASVQNAQNIQNIQNNCVQEEKTEQQETEEMEDEESSKYDTVFTGPSKYINSKYLWDINKTGCNMYSIRNIYTGLYLNSTIPNLAISKYGELFCSNNEYIWFIAPVKPLDLNNCTVTAPNCELQETPEEEGNEIIANYRNIGGEGNCCQGKLNTELCLHGSDKMKNKKIIGNPSAPWCGINNVCGEESTFCEEETTFCGEESS